MISRIQLGRTNHRRILPLVRDMLARATLVAALAAAACGGDSTVPSVPARIVFTSESELIGLRGQATLAPIVLDVDDAPIASPPPLTWASSDVAIATVDEAGVVRGIALGGPVTITVSVAGLTGTVTVRVVAAQVIISPVLDRLEVGASVQLSVEVLDALGDPIPSATVTWTNQTPTLVSLDPGTLVLEALSSGDAAVAATAAGRTSTMPILVGVPSQYDGTFVNNGGSTDAQLEVVFGRIVRFSATLRPSPTCAIPVSSTPNAIVAGDGTFNFGLVGTPGVVVGTFNSPTLVNGVVGSVPNNPSCGIASSTGNLPAVGFTAVRP